MIQAMTKPQTNKTWTELFPKVSSSSSSVQFIKCLTNFAIPSILYIRNVLPSSEFESRVVEGLALNMLKMNINNSKTKKINSWIAGAMEAFEKNYLKNMTLEINDGETDRTLEIYRINFEYASENTSNNLSFRKSRDKISIQKEAMKFLQMCYSVTKSYPELPPVISISMKLCYQDNTPHNYQPHGYKEYIPTTSTSIDFGKTIEIGALNTNHHLFQFVTKTWLCDTLTKMRESGTVNGTIKDVKNAAIDFKRDTSVSNYESSLSQLSQENAKSDTSSFICDDVIGSQGDQVRCPCLSKAKGKSMQQCLGCNYWVHTECFGIKPGTTVEIFCQICHRLNKGYISHDKAMMNLNRSFDQQTLAVQRKLLAFCYQSSDKEISFRKFEKVSGLPYQHSFIKKILKQMVAQELLMERPGDTYIVNTYKVKESYGQYFYDFSSKNDEFAECNKTYLKTPELGKRKLQTLSGSSSNVRGKILADTKNVKKKKSNLMRGISECKQSVY